MKIQCTAFALLLLVAGNHYALADGTPDTALDALYQAGNNNNASAFLTLLSDDAVFIGIDGSVRLQGQTLRSFLRDRFTRQTGWGYLSHNRKLRVSEDGSVAWFEETLEHDAIGRGWGSGVLIKIGGHWKIAQYSVSVPAPIGIAIPATPGSQDTLAPANTVSTNTSSDVLATEAQPLKPEEKKNCRRIRHKTNKVSSC